MPIDRRDVDYVARLARLDLDEEERERMGAELTHILEHAAKIQALDLAGVEPTSHAVPLHNALREDEVRSSLSQEQALANAPDKEGGRFKVPRILDVEE
ncbi:Asp-tRNA(Asn)/Glu-tRNA(Gln) amidotransferase subunit GatC [soil metagenome]